jgi:hypothetical protein
MSNSSLRYWQSLVGQECVIDLSGHLFSDSMLDSYLDETYTINTISLKVRQVLVAPNNIVVVIDSQQILLCRMDSYELIHATAKSILIQGEISYLVVEESSDSGECTMEIKPDLLMEIVAK